MSAASNKQLIQDAFDELAKGDGRAFVNLMAEDFTWSAIGTTAWTGPFKGKETVRNALFKPLFEQFADRYTNTAIRIIAEDDHEVVECRGRVTTKSGQPYNNQYCYVIRMADGRMRELTEYFDTQLVATVLAPPMIQGQTSV